MFAPGSTRRENPACCEIPEGGNFAVESPREKKYREVIS